MRLVALLVVAGCGRSNFDLADASSIVLPELLQAQANTNLDSDTIGVGLLPTRAGSLLVVGTLCFNIGAVAEPVAGITDNASKVSHRRAGGDAFCA